jgi:ADP-ribosylglycohydrolase
MALCLACSLIACGDFIPYNQLVRYKWWHKNGYMSSTGKCFDIGAATKKALNEFERRQHEFAKTYRIPLENIDYLSDPNILTHFNENCGENDAAGNGGLMRLAPVPLFFWQNPGKAVEYSGRSTLLTHGDRKAFDACRFYGALIVAALRGEPKSELLHHDFYQKHQEWFGATPLHQDVKTIAEGSYKKQNGYEDGIRGKGYVLDSLKAALWAFWSDENSFEKGVLAAINLGDDTDTTAAIYGQLAGAHYGYAALPERWVNHIYARHFIMCLSKWIVYEGDKCSQRRQTHLIASKPRSNL